MYLSIKTLHLLSMVLLFGTGLGSAYYKWMSDRSRHVAHIAKTNRQVVLADWLFTLPTVIAQPLSGMWMLHLAQISYSTPWVMMSFYLYALAAACWIPVVYLQIRMRQLSQTAFASNQSLPAIYWSYTRIWFFLGIPAFLAMVAIVFLMVNKPGGF